MTNPAREANLSSSSPSKNEEETSHQQSQQDSITNPNREAIPSASPFPPATTSEDPSREQSQQEFQDSKNKFIRKTIASPPASPPEATKPEHTSRSSTPLAELPHLTRLPSWPFMATADPFQMIAGKPDPNEYRGDDEYQRSSTTTGTCTCARHSFNFSESQL